MKTNRQNIYDRLYRIYIGYCRVFKNKDSKQMCCMWSTRDLPDEIFRCEQIHDIEAEFDVSLTEDDALEIYNMDFDDAVNFIIRLMEKRNEMMTGMPAKTSDAQSETPDEESRLCPDCGHKMMKGQMNSGRAGWACTNFPECCRIDLVHTAAELVILDAVKRSGDKRQKRK